MACIYILKGAVPVLQSGRRILIQVQPYRGSGGFNQDKI